MAVTILELLKSNFVGRKVKITQPDKNTYTIFVIDIKEHTEGIFRNVFDFIASDISVFVLPEKTLIEVVE